MKKEYQKTVVVMGLALGLPSTIIGLFMFLKFLVNQKIISDDVSLIILVAAVFNILFLMVKYGLAKKNQS